MYDKNEYSIYQYNTEFVIIVGDFNSSTDSSLDKSSLSASNPNAAKALKVDSDDAGLVDVWREFNPLVKDYTFYYARHKTHSRLDFFLLRQVSLSSAVSCSIGSILIRTCTCLPSAIPASKDASN